MNIDKVSLKSLVDRNRPVTVAIVDGGFSKIPRYAEIVGENPRSLDRHGNRVLSIFTALDKRFPISGMRLFLAAYDNSTGYGGLARTLSGLPNCDILSISLAWRDPSLEIYSLLVSKAKTICVPCSLGTDAPYPAGYGRLMTKCSCKKDPNADYCINPNPAWNGNSYAVPAVARLLAHGFASGRDSDAIDTEELFGFAGGRPASEVAWMVSIERADGPPFTCRHCRRIMMTRASAFLARKPDRCPYCGRRT